MKLTNDLPRGWVRTTVGELVQFEYGKGLIRGNRETSGICEVFGSNGPVGKHSVALVNEPCLIVGRKGAIGKVHLSQLPCWPIDTTYYVIPSHVNLRFLFHLLTWLDLGTLDRSTAIPGLNRDDAYAVPLGLPPRPEQRRIATKIEELFTKLDAGVEELRTAQVQLKRYRQTVLKAAVSGELTKQWREAHQGELEPASELLAHILKERREKWEADKLKRMKAADKTPRNDDWKEKYKEPLAPRRNGLFQLPDSWKWISAEQVGQVSGGLTKNPRRRKLASKIAYLRVANVYSGTLKLDEVKSIGIEENELERVLLNKGDLLVVEGNGSADQIGRMALWDDSITPCAHQNHIIKVRFSEVAIGKYALLWFLSKDGHDFVTKQASSTSGLFTLSISKVNSLPMPLAPLAEQTKIVEEVDRLLSISEAIEQTIEQGLKQAERMRKSILKKAFEGKLVPQDPSDEPAELLLERIKIERAKREDEKRAMSKPSRRRFTKKQNKRIQEAAA